MRVNGLCRGNAMLPFFLHLGVHDKQRIMREVDSNLALCISSFIISFLCFRRTRCVFSFTGTLITIASHNMSNPELTGDSEAQAADHWVRAEVC